ncbi:MAG: HAMP domain-containing histidine kinase [Gammaproteobacteria bacterium]|nr:HAMP domain-containing histidine kinase [Gammaproteobacteria bacterium]
MKFADILASLIHDMKNSLWLVINTLESLAGEMESSADRQKLQTLQHEAKRLNTNLIELLTLYKLENERIAANIEELNLAEFIEELVLENRIGADARGVELSWTCDDDLYGYFDEGLIRGVVNSVIGNGLRYTRSRLHLSGEEASGFLVIRVEDDGAGYPQEMLAAQDAIDDHSALCEGRTRLGLYFAGMVAKLHRNQGKEGYIRLSNQGQLDGGCFSLYLP